jgi:hypothetical protein
LGEELARLLDSLDLWLTHAPPRTLRELADHTDAHWSNTPGSRETYAARFIARLQRGQALLDPPKEDTHRPPNVTPTPARGVNFRPVEGGQFSTVVDRDWFRTASITDDAEFVGWSQWQRM